MKALVRIGDLFRCCIQTIEELPDTNVEEGTEIKCAYCAAPMLYTKAEYETCAWQRNEPITFNWG